MKQGAVDREGIGDSLVLGFHPEWVAGTAWVAPGAVVVGEVHLSDEVSVWYGAVLRGDSAAIQIGPRTNVQDGTVVHVDHGMPTRIGSDVVIGHGAVVHAATVGDGCLIAIRATVLSGAVIGEGSIVGAGALVTEGKVIPPRSLVLGIPGRVVRRVEDAEAAKVREQAARYVAYARLHGAQDGQGRGARR
jgi:carbonic anhydrase/acetyltransferase-like protein (isoleucine patch superfamily)